MDWDLPLREMRILLHRGSIKVHSVEKQGTTFAVRIPLTIRHKEGIHDETDSFFECVMIVLVLCCGCQRTVNPEQKGNITFVSDETKLQSSEYEIVRIRR